MRQLSRQGAFTLIELLVVVAVIALLISILLPALHNARELSKIAVCASNLRQVGLGCHEYAMENAGFVPRGPEPAHPFDFSGNRIGTNQLWIGEIVQGYPPANPMQYNGGGVLLEKHCVDPRVFFCPSDDNFNLARSAPMIGTTQSAYGSYIFRQLDFTPETGPQGQIDNMGSNIVAVGTEDELEVPVEALALDTNSLGGGASFHTNHNAERANVLYRDGAVRRFDNRDNALALPPEVFPNPVSILAALDQLFCNVDYAYRTGRPHEAPRLEDDEP